MSTNQPVTITANDIAEPTTNTSTEESPVGAANKTDYVFPEGWGQFTPDMRNEFFTAWRVASQAQRQDTTVGKELRRQAEEAARLDTDSHRVDDPLK